MTSTSSNSSSSSSEDETPRRHVTSTLDHSDFSPNEDGTIVKLKAGGETWANIGASIGRPKGDVQKRYKTIRAFYDKMGTDVDRIDENWARKWRADGNEIPTPERPLRLRDRRSDKGDRKEKDKSQSGGDKNGKDKKYDSSNTLTNPKPSKKDDAKRGRKNTSIASSSSEESSSSSSSSSDGSTDSEEERENQRRHIYHHVYGDLYPNRRTLTPDDFWSEHDCEVLAIVEARHDGLRWKYIQAGFFNATGRMVSVELIKHKMGAEKN